MTKPAETEDGAEDRKGIVAWAKAFAIIVGGLIAIYGAFFKGEPGAELSYKELAKAFNELRSEFAREHAFVEGFLAALKQPAVVPAAVPAAAPAPAAKCVAPTKALPVAPPVSRPPAPAKKEPKATIQQKQDLPAPMPPTLDQLQKK